MVIMNKKVLVKLVSQLSPYDPVKDEFEEGCAGVLEDG